MYRNCCLTCYVFVFLFFFTVRLSYLLIYKFHASEGSYSYLYHSPVGKHVLTFFFATISKQLDHSMRRRIPLYRLSFQTGEDVIWKNVWLLTNHFHLTYQRIVFQTSAGFNGDRLTQEVQIRQSYKLYFL